MNNTTQDNFMSLSDLVNLLPFDEVHKKQLLGVIDKLDADQRYQLTRICWDMLTFVNEEERQYKVGSAINEMAKGGKGYTPADFSKMGEDILQTFTQKLEKSEEVKKLEEIRQELKTVTSQLPTNSPEAKTTPSSPVQKP